MGGKDGTYTFGFDRIANRGASAVRLKVPGLRKAQLALGVGSLDEINLRCDAGLRDGRCPAVLVHRSTTNNGADGIPISDSLGQTLQNDNADSFTSAVSVSPLVESKRAAIGRKELLSVERDGQWARVKMQLNATNKTLLYCQYDRRGAGNGSNAPYLTLRATNSETLGADQ
jgi:hypothetical protein